MAITAAVPNSFKAELLAGTHAAADVYKIALYTSSATLSKATTAYSATNEVSATGYTAGGQTLTGYAAGAGSDVAWIDFDDAVWANSSIGAAGALIYNSSKSNKAVAVLDFGGVITSTNGPFTVKFPTAGSSTALLRIA